MWAVALYHAKDDWQDVQRILSFETKKLAIAYIERVKPYRWALKEIEHETPSTNQIQPRA